jgi:hypothetical protein
LEIFPFWCDSPPIAIDVKCELQDLLFETHIHLAQQLESEGNLSLI